MQQVKQNVVGSAVAPGQEHIIAVGENVGDIGRHGEANHNSADNRSVLLLHGSHAGDKNVQAAEARDTAEQTAEKINNKVWKEDIDGKYIAAQINISPEDVIIEAKHINLKGAVTLSAFSDELKDTFNSMVKSVKTEYAESNSNQIAPTSGWSENAPAYNKDKYIWQKTTTTFSNGNSISSNPTCISGYNGVDGKDGADGANGISVSSIIPLYYASNSNAAPSIDKNTSIYNDSTVGRWTTVQPDFNKNYKYIYVCSKITYSNGTVQFSTVTQENVLTRLVQWCKENDVTKIDGANIYTGSIAADAIDVNDLFAQNIKATGTIEGAKLKGTSIEGRSQIVIFNPNNGNKRIGIYNESVNKYAQMNDYSGIIHINGDYAGWIVGGQLCLGKYTGSYTEGEISKLSIDFENGIILQGRDLFWATRLFQYVKINLATLYAQ